MIARFDYHDRIIACAQWAETAPNDHAKLVWKEMERFWRQRATGSCPKPDALPNLPAAVVNAAAQARRRGFIVVVLASSGLVPLTGSGLGPVTGSRLVPVTGPRLETCFADLRK